MDLLTKKGNKMEVLLYSFATLIGLIVGFCSVLGFLNVLFDDCDHGVIGYFKSDADKFRYIPRIIFKFFIFIIENSYKIGVFLGGCLKFIFIKETK